MISETLLAYMAGFFDGEGSVVVRRNKKGRGSLGVSIAQKDTEPLELIQDTFGGTISVHVSSSQCYALQMTGKRALDFLSAIRPFLIVKARVADAGIELGKMVGPSGRHVSLESLERRRIVEQWIRDINQRRV